jgi:hypothetical protein
MLVNQLFEATKPSPAQPYKGSRKKNLKYTELEIKGKVERITVQLEGKQSEKFTKVAKRYKQLQRLVNTLKEKQDALNADIRENLLEYFDEKDKVYTRMVETISLTAALSKEVASGENVDHEKIVNDLVAGIIKLQPKLEKQINELLDVVTKAATTPKKTAAAKLTVKVEEGKIADAWNAVKGYIASALSRLRNMGKEYDAELNALKKQAAALK